MIGILDSGIGGLSVWKELIETLPTQNYLYVADSGHCPYGPKEKSYITERVFKISEFLIERGADIIVVACNTATAASIEALRANFNTPFIGMEPATKPAALDSKSGVIAVLATEGTFKGELYIGTRSKYASDIKVIEVVGAGLVELVERREWESVQAERLLRGYIEPMIEAGADHLVLGCTHYPFLTKMIEKIAGSRLKIVNPAPAVAKRAKEVLSAVGQKKIYIKDCDIFYTTAAEAGVMESIVKEILLQSKNQENRERKIEAKTINL